MIIKWWPLTNWALAIEPPLHPPHTPRVPYLVVCAPQRQGKVQEIYLKCSKARNEYLLNLAAAKSSMKKYYLQDISTLIDVSALESLGFFRHAMPTLTRWNPLSDQCADAGYHLSLGQVMQAYLSGRTRTQQNLDLGLQQLQNTVSGLDQIRDRDTLLQEHTNTFCMPLNFSYQPHDGDQVSEVIAECEMRFELETRFRQIQSRLKGDSEETNEVPTLHRCQTGPWAKFSLQCYFNWSAKQHKITVGGVSCYHTVIY